MTLNWLPPLVLLEEYNGSWDVYLDAVYGHFRTDFLCSRLCFRNVRVGLKRHPVVRDKEATFWHFISEGKVEADRTINLRRCERIRWPRQMLEQETALQLPVWTQERKGKPRIVIALPDFSYIFVLDERTTETGDHYYLPWTTIYVEYERRRGEYRQEWLRNQNLLLK